MGKLVKISDTSEREIGNLNTGTTPGWVVSQGDKGRLVRIDAQASLNIGDVTGERAKRAQTVTERDFQHHAGLRRTYGTYTNYLDGVKTYTGFTPEELRDENLGAALNAQTTESVANTNASPRAKHEGGTIQDKDSDTYKLYNAWQAGNETAKRLDNAVSEGEFNRSQAMQEQYGTYNDYINVLSGTGVAKANYYLSMPDFEEKSKYKSTANGKEVTYTPDGTLHIMEDGYDDILYDYINGDKTAQDTRDYEDSRLNETHKMWKDLDPTIVGIFNYLYAEDEAKGDSKHTTAYEYIDSVVPHQYTAVETGVNRFIENVGIAPLLTGGGALVAAITGDDELKQQNRQVREDWNTMLAQQAQQHPIAATVGGFAGSTALMAATGAVAGSLTAGIGTAATTPFAGIKFYNTSSTLIRTAARGAITYGLSEAVQGLGNVSTGITTAGQYSKNILRRAAQGAAGKIAGELVATKIGYVLAEKRMMTPFMEFVRQSSRGIANSLTGNAVSYILADEKPTGREIAENLITSFAFSVINGAIDASNTVAAWDVETTSLAERLTNMYTELCKYGATLTPEAQAQYRVEMQEVTELLQMEIHQRYNYVPGQQEKMDQIDGALSIIGDWLSQDKLTGAAYTGYADADAAELTKGIADAITEGMSEPISQPPETATETAAKEPPVVQPGSVTQLAEQVETPKESVTLPTYGETASQNETAVVKSIQGSAPILSEMPIVATAESGEEVTLEDIPATVQREGIGEIEIPADGEVEQPELLPTIPEVLKKGTEIEITDSSRTIAAPVELDDNRVNVATVVEWDGENKPYLSEATTEKGQIFKAEDRANNAENKGRLVLPTAEQTDNEVTTNPTGDVPTTLSALQNEQTVSGGISEGNMTLPTAAQTNGITLPRGEITTANTRNGGIINEETGLENVQRTADGKQIAMESKDTVYGGDTGGRPSYADTGRTERIPEGVRGLSKENRELTLQRQRAVEDMPLVSSADIGIANGTPEAYLRILPEDDWDEELRTLRDWAHSKGIKNVRAVVGALTVDNGDGPVSVLDVINKETGEVVIRADSLSRSATETMVHAIGHYLTDESMVRQFMETVKSRKPAAWQAMYEKYKERWARLTNYYEDMTDAEIELYVWEEIMEDAYANINNYGMRASTFHDEAYGIIEGTETPERGSTVLTGAGATAAAYSDTTGPPERYRFSIANTRDLSWEEQVDRYFSKDGTIKSSDSLYLGESNVEGVPDAPLYIPTSVITKATRIPRGSRSAHGLSETVIRGLNKGIEKAPAVIHNPARNSLVYLTEDKLLVAFDLNNNLNGENAHKATSIHKRDNPTPMLKNLDGNATIFVRNENKLNHLLCGNQIQSLELLAKVEFTGDNIPPATNGVKGYFDENGKIILPKYESEAEHSAPPSEQIKDIANEKPTRNKDIRFSAEDVPETKEEDTELAESTKDYKEELKEKFPLEELIIDDYENNAENPVIQTAETEQKSWKELEEERNAQTLEQREKERAAQLLRNVGRKDFKGTPALEKLGVKISNSVGIYQKTDSLRKSAEAARRLEREIRKAERDLKATAAEKNFASGIAAGIYTAEDIPARLNTSAVIELAELYWAEQGIATNRLSRQRQEIKNTLNEKMSLLLQDSTEHKTSSAAVMNYRTPERNMLHIFGDELGEKINAAVFDPVAENEAERYRFINRMHNEVRKFEDKKGRKRELTKDERALVQKVIEGRAAGETVASMEMGESIRRAGENIKSGKTPEDAAKEFGLKYGERKLAEKYSRWLSTQEELEKADDVIIRNAANKYSELFDMFYDGINDFLVAHGYEPIGFIKGYAPHIQPEENQNLLNRAIQSLGISTEVTELPASIAGRTADLKPNKRWNPYFLSRNSDLTQFDIATAFESYVDYMSDVLYHTDDVMRVRAMGNYLRRMYAPEEIRENISWAQNLRNASTAEKASFLRDNGVIERTSALNEQDINAQFEKYVENQFANIKNTTKYSNLVSYLDNYANILAGKQSMADRGAEYAMGRKWLQVGNKINSAFAKAQVAANLSSMVNQVAQLPMIKTELGERWTWAAVVDALLGKATYKKWAKDSDFLTGKRGIDYLVNTPGEEVTRALFWGAEAVDKTVSTIAVRGKYRKELHAGKSHEEAMKAADAFGKAVMGSRMKGSKPLAFHSKRFFMQLANMFQIEAINSWEHVTQDLPREARKIAKEKGKVAASAWVARMLVMGLISAFVLNRITEETYGGTPAPFDLLGLTANFVASGEGLTTNDWIRTIIDNVWEEKFGERLFDTPELKDEPFDAEAAIKDTLYNISNDIPFVRNVTGLLGLGDATMPMPDLYGGISDIVNASVDYGFISPQNAKAGLGLITELIPGGRQISKTAQGIETIIREGDYSGYGENEKLKYPLESDEDKVKALLFGKYTTDAAREYYASGDKMLTAKQTQVYNSLVDAGADSEEVYDAIQEYSDLGNDDSLSSYERGVEQRNIIRDMNLTDKQKLYMYRGLSSADATADKLQEIMNAGLNFNQAMDVLDEYKLLYGDEESTQTEKATDFAYWLDNEDYSSDKQSVIMEQFKFYNQVPAEPETYEKFTASGLDSSAAMRMTEAIRNLEPLEGKKQVTDTQKWRAAIDVAEDQDEQRKALKALMKDSALEKYEIADSYGISPTAYVTFKEILPNYDFDGNGSYKNEEITAAIDSMGGGVGLVLPGGDGNTKLTLEQQAVLWQLYTNSDSAKNNPFSTQIGWQVIKAREDDTESVKLVLPE